MIAEMEGLAEGENERKRVPSRWQDQKPSAISARSLVCGRAAHADIAGDVGPQVLPCAPAAGPQGQPCAD